VDDPLVYARAVHFAATIAAAGVAFFTVFVTEPALRKTDAGTPLAGIIRRRLAWLGLYAVAMAFVEAAVVVDLRALYYPGGFGFPLAPMPPGMATIEIAREAATVVMILAVAVLAAGSRMEAFLLFAWVFGVWDIFYYVWLRVALGWPASLMTPDILFLIPVPWVGPVLAPILVSGGLILGATLLLRARARGVAVSFRPAEWGAAIAGGNLILLSFTVDGRAVLAGGPVRPFRWVIFGAGVATGAWALRAALRRFRRIMATSRFS